MAAGEGELFAGKRPEQAKVPEAKPEPPFTHINGDRAEYTGNTETIHGGLFYEVKYTEGRKAGTTAVTRRSPDGAKPASKRSGATAGSAATRSASFTARP